MMSLSDGTFAPGSFTQAYMNATVHHLVSLAGMCEASRRAPVRSTDEDLVAAVRRGDDRAYEELYERYQRRVTAYVFGMVNDHGRAEDLGQEIFISALRRMRQTDRP